MDIITYILAKMYTDKAVKEGSVVIDAALSETSKNPVQNKTITAKIKEIVNKFTTTDETISTLKTTVDDVDAWKGDTEARITQLEGTGKVLPAVTSADAGKYLRVSADGSWEVASVNKLGDIAQK